MTDQFNSANYKRIVSNNFKTINLLFLTSICVALVILFSKIYGLKEFKWNDIVFPLSSSWIVFLLLTIANIYFSIQLHSILVEILRKRDKQLNKEIYSEITSSENIFIRGINRTPIITSAILKTSFIVRPPFKKDMAYWLRVSIDLLIFIAIVWPVSQFASRMFLLNFNIGFIILAVNGFFTSRYLVKFYLLAYDKYSI